MQRAPKESRERLKNLLAQDILHEKDIRSLFQLCFDTGVLDSVGELFSTHISSAQNILDGLPDSGAKKRLRNLIDAMGYWRYFKLEFAQEGPTGL
jgi:hypothetical protein